MDEFEPILNTDEPGAAEEPTAAEQTGAAEEPREVVLRYAPEFPAVRPVVERYVQPTPLPGRRRGSRYPRPRPETLPAPAAPAEAAQLEDAEEPALPRRARYRGLRIFLGCIAGLVLLSIVITLLPRPGRREASGEGEEYEFRFELRPDSAEQSAETTIPRYPNGDGTRLRYSETHGKVLRIQDIYARVNPCTVTIATALADGSAMVGTGVIFSHDGYILTNAHVVTGGTQCFVVLDNGVAFDSAQLVGYDTAQDLAVIKINALGLPVAEFGDSDALTVGDTVYAIGNPLGVELRGTLTDGIVSAINRDVTVDGVKMTLIQTNAALNNGNSGGPLINIYGQVVGINAMKMGSSSTVSVEGLGFAIPISSTAWMVDDLIEYGEVRGEPMIGVTVENAALPTGEAAVRVHEVVPDGAAAKAGLQEGDFIVAADGEPLETTNDLLRVRRRYRAGDTLTMEIDRGGERFTAAVVLEEASDQ